VDSSWLKEFHFTYATHFTDKDRVTITVYCGSYNEVLDEQREQLPIVGYFRTDKTPVFSHKASGLYLFGNSWPNQIATRELIAHHVIFTDGSVPIELPAHPTLGQAVNHMKVQRGHCIPIFRTPQGRFVTENGCAVIYKNNKWMREIVPGRLLADLNFPVEMYDGNGRGPLRDQSVDTIGDNYVVYECNDIYYAFIENRIEIYRKVGDNSWALTCCEPLY
jgi:hypothetical protein